MGGGGGAWIRGNQHIYPTCPSFTGTFSSNNDHSFPIFCLFTSRICLSTCLCTIFSAQSCVFATVTLIVIHWYNFMTGVQIGGIIVAFYKKLLIQLLMLISSTLFIILFMSSTRTQTLCSWVSCLDEIIL